MARDQGGRVLHAGIPLETGLDEIAQLASNADQAPQGAGPVVATARSATSEGRGEDIRLYEDVQLVRAAYRDAGGMHSELVMRTSYLQVIPDRNLAVTDRPVTIEDADTHVTANGLEFNNETRVLKLTGNVRGTYTNPKR